jgi:hypothetical protein
MSTGRSTCPKPLLSLGQAARIWTVGGVLLGGAILVGVEGSERLSVLVPAVFYLGHYVLAFALARRRLSLDALADWRWSEVPWTEVVTVFCVPWVGPIGWYVEWRKANNPGQRPT